jgi:hypothetical protein
MIASGNPLSKRVKLNSGLKQIEYYRKKKTERNYETTVFRISVAFNTCVFM